MGKASGLRPRSAPNIEYAIAPTADPRPLQPLERSAAATSGKEKRETLLEYARLYRELAEL